MNKSNKKVNYYTFIAFRKIFRFFKGFNLIQPSIRIAYLTQTPRTDINDLLEWYFPVDYKITVLIASDKIDFCDFDLVLYELPRVKFSLPILKDIHKVATIHSSYYSIAEISNWTSLYPMTLSNKEIKKYKLKYQENLQTLKNKNVSKKSWIFGTGPSIESYLDLNINKNSLKIICNSIVKNKKFCETTKPDIVACADPVFHFGHSRYARQFRLDLVEGMMAYKLMAIMPLHHALLFSKHFPQLENQIIGVELSNKWNFNLTEDLSVHSSENILSLLLLPIAATFTKEINLIGFDGKSPDQTDYFWEHHSNFQYVDLMEDVKSEHQSFFSDRDYSSYSKKHEKNIDLIFQKLEDLGIKIKSHAKSFIPSINARS